MPVGVLLASMSSRELSEWMAYYEIEPFGEVRDDLRAGIVASAVVNVHRKKGTKAVSPAAFMFDFETDVSEPDADDLRAKFRAATSTQQ